MSKKYPVLKLYKRDNDTIEGTVTYEEDDSAVDLENAIVKFTLRRVAYDDVVLMQLTSENPLEINISEPGSGIFEMYFQPSGSENLDPRKYVFDVQVKLQDGTIHTTHDDYIKFLEDVTKES